MLYSNKTGIIRFTLPLVVLLILTACQTIDPHKEPYPAVEELINEHDVVISIDSKVYGNLIRDVAAGNGLSSQIDPIINRTNFFYAGISFEENDDKRIVFLGDGRYPSTLIRGALKQNIVWEEKQKYVFLNNEDGSSISLAGNNCFIFSSTGNSLRLLENIKGRLFIPGENGKLGIYFKDFNRLTGLPGLDKLVNFTLKNGFFEIEYDEQYQIKGSLTFEDEKYINPFKTVFKFFLFSLSRSSHDKTLSKTMKTMTWETNENILTFKNLYIENMDSSLYGLFLPEVTE